MFSTNFQQIEFSTML